MSSAPHAPIDMTDVRSAVMAATDAQDLERRLAQLIGKENPAFGETLAKASFTAELLGFVSAEAG